MTKSQVIIWAAGFFDGEGSIGVYPNKHKGYNIHVRVGQKDIKPLMILQNVWGGRIWYEGDIYRWTIESHKAIKEFLTDIQPWIFVKAAETKTLLQYFELSKSWSDSGKRAAIVRDFKAVQLERREA